MGTSETLRNNGNKVEDHPHACGDKFSDCQHSNTAPGSSPRVWGQGVGGYMRVVNYRIIPTRVGTSYVCKQNEGTQQDHPHACGDKYTFGIAAIPSMGSSPRVWGQAGITFPLSSLQRIIPTRVGTRNLYFAPFCRIRDHPHACGDKLRIKSRLRQIVGSSPRVWGQAPSSWVVCSIYGIIPTRVGTSRKIFTGRGSVGDHPHACGDK